MRGEQGPERTGHRREKGWAISWDHWLVRGLRPLSVLPRQEVDSTQRRIRVASKPLPVSILCSRPGATEEDTDEGDPGPALRNLRLVRGADTEGAVLM